MGNIQPTSWDELCAALIALTAPGFCVYLFWQVYVSMKQKNSESTDTTHEEKVHVTNSEAQRPTQR